MARRWTTVEYEQLFRDHRPTEPRAPSGRALNILAATLERSPGAVKAQWDDGRSAVLSNRSAASTQLIGYLRHQGWLQ